MRHALVALAFIASPALAQQGTTAPTPAHESRYGVTTGSPLSSTAHGPTGGSAMSTARLPTPGASDQRRAQPPRPATPTVGGYEDRAAPMSATGPHP